jgi:hypothetical protein
MLFERGYVIAYREENPLTRHATEVVFLRLFCERGVAGTHEISRLLASAPAPLRDESKAKTKTKEDSAAASPPAAVSASLVPLPGLHRDRERMLTQPPTCSFLAGSVAPDVAARVFGTISKFFDDYSRLVPAFDRAFNVSTDKNRPFSDLIPVFPELCPHPQRYPERSLDGGKVSCHHAWLNSSDCVVLSLGSNNDFQFEESISAQSLCRTHTYDCTSNPPPRPILRHSFSKKCLGNSTNDLFVSYASALREAHAHN